MNVITGRGLFCGFRGRNANICYIPDRSLFTDFTAPGHCTTEILEISAELSGIQPCNIAKWSPAHAMGLTEKSFAAAPEFDHPFELISHERNG